MSVPAPTTPTNPADDLREQVARALSKAATSRGYRLRDERAPLTDAALSVVAPVLEGLRAEIVRLCEDLHRTQHDRDYYRKVAAEWYDARPAVSDQTPQPISLQCAHQVAQEIAEEAEARRAALANREAVSDQTPGTPDDAAARHMADVTRHPRFAELYAQAAHNVHARDNHDQGDERAEAAVPAVHAEWDADGDFRSADCLAKGCPLCVSSDWAKRQVPSSVQGDTTPEEA